MNAIFKGLCVCVCMYVCVLGGGQLGMVIAHLVGVTRLSIESLILIWSRLHDRWSDPSSRQVIKKISITNSSLHNFTCYDAQV